VLLIYNIMDEVEYNAQGNRVKMVKATGSSGSKLNSLTQIPLTTNTSETFPFVQSSASTGTASFWRAWRWWLPPAVIALALVLYFVDPFIGDWDGMDYTMLSLAGYPSSMALGRNLFIFRQSLSLPGCAHAF
jgi:hypothetical protein